MDNPILRVALHPLFLAGVILSFLSVTLPKYFQMAPLWTWLIALAIGLLTLVSGQMKAAHSDLAINVSQGTFHLIIACATYGGIIFQMISASLATAPFTVPTILAAILAIGFGLCQIISNQLNLQGPADAPALPPAA